MHVASSSLFARSLHDALPIFIKVRLHAFFSLIVVAVATGLAAGIGVGDVIDVVIDGFSDTVGTVALLVGFGAVLGRLIGVTGGAQVLAAKMLDTVGEGRAPQIGRAHA